MAEVPELLRGWLRTREALGDPPVFLPVGARGVALARVRALARGGGGEAVGSAPAAAPHAAAPAGGRVGRRVERRSPAPAAGRTPGPGSVSTSPAGPAAPATLGPADVERLAREVGAAEIEALGDLADVRAVASRCVRCGLHASRRHVVFADGSPEARVMCVGEAPGAVEDETGLPFVGPAGKLLDRLLLAVGFRRSDVYICNVIKCRPPNNRNPTEVEIERCSPFLRRQVALVRPEVILALGTFAAQTLVGTRESIGRLRGRTHLYADVPLVVTYHPAALLRNPGWTRPTWEDLQLARRIVDGTGGVEVAHPAPELELG